MTKRLLSLLLLAGTALNPLLAQTPELDFRADVHRSASNYQAYPGPTQARLTPAPKGMRPFYISHYGRHGSRYLSNKYAYDYPYHVLKTADSLGVLSPLGRDVYRRVCLVHEESAPRLGELTPLGARQHREIARRMVERFPEVFAGPVSIDARSTTVIRCILSMENALQQLLKLNPRLDIQHDASQHDMYYMNLQDKALFAQRMTPPLQTLYDAFCRKHERYGRVVASLFSDTAYVAHEVNGARLSYYLFKLASNLQSSPLGERITLYDIFDAEEVLSNWRTENVWWYMCYGFYPGNGARQPYSQRNLLRRIIEEADSCIRLKRPGATLRFGHETMVLPLTCLLGLNGYDLQTDNLEELEQRGWLNYKVFPMAANIQFVFYRRSPRDRDVLVKVLLNEDEARLPLPAHSGPYYRWADVRRYYLEKLDSYQD